MPAVSKKEWSSPSLPRCPVVVRRWMDVAAFGAIVLGGLALLMAMNTHALAQEADDTTERIAVAYTAADLADPDHIRRLLKRIDRAALQACGDNPWEAAPIRAAIAHSDCRRESVLRAAAQSGNPTLRRAAADYMVRLNP